MKYIELVKGLFTADHEARAMQAEPYIAYSKEAGKLMFSSPKIEEVFYDIMELVKKSIPVPSEGYREVDLGLSVKWADRNVGAENPWDNGAYFSWGNVEGVVSNGTTKKSEDYIIEQLIIISVFDGEGTPEQIEEVKNNSDIMNQLNQMIPIVTGLISEYSFDESTYATTLGGQYTGSTLDTEHDAAAVNMGRQWRMPTSGEILELIENTDHYYIDNSGSIVSESELAGYIKLRSICFAKKGEAFNYDIRSNFIEFPFAGSCLSSVLGCSGLNSFIWAGSTSESNAEQACFLYFDSDGGYGGGSDYYSSRYCGFSVRGVHV